MLIIPPPLSNYERQVRFRKSHPGYFRQYKRNRRRLLAAGMAAHLLAIQAGQAPPPDATPLPASRDFADSASDVAPPRTSEVTPPDKALPLLFLAPMGIPVLARPHALAA